MAQSQQALPRWFPYLDLGLVGLAGALWYASPGIGPWPLLLALAPWGARLVINGRATRGTSFDILLVALLLIAGVGVWSAFDRQAAWSKFWLIVGGVLVFYALANAQAIGDARIWLLAALGAGLAFYFLATHDWDAHTVKIAVLTQAGKALQAVIPNLPGPRLNPNVAGGIMAVLVPYAGLAVAQSVPWRQTRRVAPSRWLTAGLAAVLLILTCLGVLASASRGAWIGLAAAMLVAAVWAVARRLARITSVRQTWVFLAMAGVASALAVVIFLAWPGDIDALLAAIPLPDTAIPRMHLLRGSLTLASDYPLIGGGLAGFMMLHTTYALLLHVGMMTHSHNLYMSVAVELGAAALLVLFLAWLRFGIAYLRRGLRAATDSDVLPGEPAFGAAALALIVMLIHGLVDDVLFSSGGMLVAFVPLAFAVPFAVRLTRRAARSMALALPIAIIAVLVLILFWRDPILSRIYSNLGAVSQSRAELGVYTWPEWPVQDAVRREIDLERTIAFYERALELDSRNPSANRRLGQIELSLAEYEDALMHLEAAYEVDAGNGTLQQFLGEAYLANGEIEAGLDLLSNVDNGHQGALLVRQAWYRIIGREDMAEWIGQAAGQ